MITSSDHIAEVLETCLERLRAGDTVAACLHDYPYFSEELSPLLTAADHVRRAPPPQLSSAARQAIQRQLRSAVVGRMPRRTSAPRWYQAPALRFATMLVVLFLAFYGGTVGVAAAQSSLPGSPLYPVKRAGEALQLSLSSSPARRAELYLNFAHTRLAETLALLDNQQPTDERVLEDLARDYDLAWANIRLLPAAQAQAQRGRFIAEGQAQVRALTEVLDRVPQAHRASLEATLRSGQAALTQAVEKTSPTQSETPANDHQPTPHASPPSNGQGNGGNPPTSKPDNQPGNNGQGTPPTPKPDNQPGNNGQGTPPTPKPDNQPGNNGQGTPPTPKPDNQPGNNGQGQDNGQNNGNEQNNDQNKDSNDNQNGGDKDHDKNDNKDSKKGRP
jgi:Domain of unknown function (DUF5667)